MGNIDSNGVKNYLDSKYIYHNNQSITYTKFAFGFNDVNNFSIFVQPKIQYLDCYNGIYLLILFNQYKDKMFDDLILNKKEIYGDLFYSWFIEYLNNNYIDIVDGKYVVNVKYVRCHISDRQPNNDISHVSSCPELTHTSILDINV